MTIEARNGNNNIADRQTSSLRESQHGSGRLARELSQAAKSCNGATRWWVQHYDTSAASTTTRLSGAGHQLCL